MFDTTTSLIITIIKIIIAIALLGIAIHLVMFVVIAFSIFKIAQARIR